MAAMLVLNPGYVHAQTAGQIPMFNSAPGYCNSAAGVECVDSMISQDPSGNIHVNGGIVRIDFGGFSQSSVGTFDVDAPDVSGGRLRILENGNVGIGVTNPENKLAIAGEVPVFNGTAIELLNTAGGNTNKWALGAGGAFVPADGFSIGDSSEFRLVISGNGNVGIATVAPAFKLDVAGAAHASSFPTSSDMRLKKDVRPLTGVLEKIEKIRGVTFDWNERYEALGRSTGKREMGVIAQEIETVFPELVTTWGDEGYRAVDYGRLTAVLVEAVKELRRENEALMRKTSEIDGLRAQLGDVSELKAQASRLQSLVQTLLTQQPDSPSQSRSNPR